MPVPCSSTARPNTRKTWPQVLTTCLAVLIGLASPAPASPAPSAYHGPPLLVPDHQGSGGIQIFGADTHQTPPEFRLIPVDTGPGVYIGPNVSIGPNVRIGGNVQRGSSAGSSGRGNPQSAVGQAEETPDPTVAIAAARFSMHDRLPIPPNYPAPSILVGFPAGEKPSSATIGSAPANLLAEELDLSDPTTRATLRDDDPELFATMLSSGAFDPTAQEIARALQNELALMGCYTSAVDGIWGDGSRAALGRFFDMVGEATTETEPTVELYRLVRVQRDARCQLPTRAGATATPTGRSSPSLPSTAPEAQPAEGARIDPDAVRSGILRGVRG